MTQIERLLEDLRKRLVETGTRNRLVHVNRKNMRAKAVPIIDERSEDIFEILRVKKTKMQFAARGTEEEEDPSGLVLSVEEKQDEGRYTDKFLDTPFAPDTLQKKLLSVSRDARTAEEEQGINILYLAMGFLTWFENKNSDVVREAPLILIPIDLIRNKRSSSFDVVTRDDDIVTNLPLHERLLNDFGIELPEIDDTKDWSPKEYFKKVSDAISSQTRWSIDKDGMQVGFFSFAKLLMLKDLDPANWPSGSLLENPIIQGLLGSGFETEAPLFEDNDNLDEAIQFSDLLHVIDADASQTKVIQEVRSGRNLVVQGPPGTGKSQTITNILSAAVHDGKKVLFVAEKMAALNVVYRRMSILGLKDLCVELHSRNANKRLFFEELARTLLNKTNKPNQLQNVEEHIETRNQLNEISKSLHLKLNGEEFSPFDVLSKLIKFMGDDAPPPRLGSPVLEFMNEEQEKEVLRVIDEFVNLHDKRKDFTDHPFRFVGTLDLQPTELERVIAWIKNILGFCQGFMKLAEKFSEKHKIKNPKSLGDFRGLKDFIETVEKAPEADESFWNICLKEANNPSSDFFTSLGKALVWSSAKSKFEEDFFESVWGVDLPRIRRDIKSGSLSWFQRIFGPYRKSSNELASFSKTEFPKSSEERLTLIDGLVQAQNDKKSFDKDKIYLANAIGDNWREENTNFSMIANCWNWLETAGEFAKQCSGGELVQLITAIKKDVASGQEVIDAGVLFLENIQNLGADLNIDHYLDESNENEFGAVYEELKALSDNKDSYREWVLYDAKRKHLSEIGLEDLLSDIDEGVTPIDRVKTEFIYALNEARWKRIIAERPALISFSRLDRHEIVDRFREYETSRILETRLLIKDEHLSQLPTGANGEMGILRGEINKKKRHRPIRQVIKNAASMVQRIKPVFLMSPVSVAQFLTPETIEFDMLVIDEASQVKPEDAIGAIARAKQVVVVGDTKQLPPTSFFDRLMENTNDDEDDDVETQVVAAGDMESILKLCDARGLPNSMLRWHYRSRDPSLIACSNDEFYEKRLIIPPSPSMSDPALGMSFNKVSGIYSSASKGGGRRGTNQVEAEKIADRLLEISKNTPDYSVGIATFSKSQADMITEVLELKRRADPHLDAILTPDGIEPVFIKNIENVQGDERDIILVSVGYGPHEAGGRLASMNFGPVNAEGGERRLNVLFTRARIACEIFCSFEPSDIDLNRSKKYGTQVFKKFLEFAKSGSLPLVGDDGGNLTVNLKRMLLMSYAQWVIR